MICPRCQAKNPPDAIFCEECGARLEVACRSCGELNLPQRVRSERRRGQALRILVPDARRAVEAAGKLLVAAGYVNPAGALFSVGVGVHKGTAFVGTVAGAEGTVTDIAALGHDVHIAARLSSTAAAGEALISEAACLASGLDLDHLDRRQVQLKGRTEPLAVRVMRIQ